MSISVNGRPDLMYDDVSIYERFSSRIVIEWWVQKWMIYVRWYHLQRRSKGGSLYDVNPSQSMLLKARTRYVSQM